MRTLKISLLVFILSITISAQQEWFWQNRLPLKYLIEPSFRVQNTMIQRMDSLISNSVTGGKLKMIFEYDNNDNMTELFIGGWISGSGWFYDLKDEYYYDEDNKLLIQLDLELNGTSWDSAFQFNYLYNTQGQLNEFIIQKYIGNTWENFLRNSFEYDIYGNEIRSLTEEWQNGWQNLHMFTNYFSNINRRDSLLFQVWNSTEWENYSKTAFTYNQQTGFLEYFIGKFWNNGPWVNYINRQITNDQNGNQTLQVDQLWNGNNWENSIRRFFTYDDLNYTLTAYCELWNGTDWYLDDGDIIIENPDGFRRGFLMNNVFIYYKTTGISNDENSILDNFDLYQNFPNPFNPTTTIQFQIPELGLVTIKVYDLLGREIATLVNEEKPAGEYEVEFDAAGLTSGVYFYQLRTREFIQTKKMILMK